MDAIPERAKLEAPLFDPRLYDFLFGLPLIAWCALNLYVRLPMLAHEIAMIAKPYPDFLVILDAMANGATLLFAAVLAVFIAIRMPATSRTKGFLPRAVAFLGAFIVIVIINLPPADIGWPLKLVSTTLILGGMSFAVYSLLFLGRSISVFPEARALVTSGPYAWVRHPLYLGEELAIVGVTLQFISPVALSVLAMQIGFQIYRIKFEEQVMRAAFLEYDEYARFVKRIVPGLF